MMNKYLGGFTLIVNSLFSLFILFIPTYREEASIMNESPRNSRSLRGNGIQRWVSSLLVVFMAVWMTGCDKVQELVQGEPESTEVTGDPIARPENPSEVARGTRPQVETVAPVNPEPVKPVTPDPPKVNPQEVIDRLLNTEPKSMNNGLLAEAAALESGLEQITELDLNRSFVTDAGLVHLDKFPELTTVDLSMCKITAAGLTPIVSHPKIHTLILHSTAVGDAGIDQIIGMLQLKDLDLTSCKITDAGVEKLAVLENLERLILNQNQPVSGATFKIVAVKCKSLRVLGVDRTSFAPMGFATLKGTGIEELHASNARVDNFSFYELRHCKELKKLYVSYNPGITDAGVFKLIPALAKQLTDLSLAGTGGGAGLANQSFTVLMKCKKLKTLDLSNTNPPKDYVNRLRGKLPETEIFWDGK
ncbi:MAG: hypothetical protein ACI9HK_000972 [Pirellulaceae bacterium]|jgi:hypothetical protein